MSADPGSLRAQLRDALRTLPPPDEALSRSQLAWFALAPLWPQSVIEQGFPGIEGDSLTTGDEALKSIRHAVESGLLRTGPGEPPWGTWYWMEVSRRVYALERILGQKDGGTDYLGQHLGHIGRRLSSAPPRLGYPPALRRFAKLAEAFLDDTMDVVLDRAVVEAIESARREESTACPEAARWIEAAAPLARVFSGPLAVALERARRRLELFERVSRDERFLDHYTQREKLQGAFLELLSEKADDSWALHYVGDGGMGKTMLIRHITGPCARQHALVTSHIDFDHVNPDYPSRAPGLLLTALAADLKLSDDDSVVEILRKMYIELESVQRSADLSLRTGARLSADVERRLHVAEDYFVEALRSIPVRSRVVLILDTCEELARIRSDGELPDSVVKTFELLERLHANLSSLRVVFCGRRQLASIGYEWSGPNTQLPARPYLRRAYVQGFDREESELFFSGYGRGEQPVRAELRDKIRHLSRIEQPGEQVERYNPFDLNLYASWVCRSDENAGQLLSAGAHFYARERIVNRVSRLIRPLLPFIARIGEFDRDLLAELVPAEGEAFDNIVEEVTRQEWVDAVRGSRVPIGADEEPLPMTWRVNLNIARRLVRFFSEAPAGDPEAAEWQESTKRLKGILPRMVLGRPWQRLTLDYVAVATDLLADEPEKLVAWWEQVERKIVRERALEWGTQILATIRTLESEVHKTLPVSALLLATEMVIRLKREFPNPYGPALQSGWGSVANLVTGVPYLRKLAYRAAIGIVGSRRWFGSPMREGYLYELFGLVERVPSPDSLGGDALSDPEIAATELGLIDNVVDILEAIPWSGGVASLSATFRARLSARSASLQPHLPPRLSAFLEMRMVRLARLAGETSAISQTSHDLTRQEYVDWSEPQSVSAQIMVELLSSIRFSSRDPLTDERIVWPRLSSASSLHSLDDDRVWSMLLLTESDQRVPEDVDDSLIAASIDLNSQQAPECQMHRAVPPFFQTALEVCADRGRVVHVLKWCDRISQDSSRSADVQLAAERVKMAVVARWRLAEMGFGLQSQLDASTRLDDAVLVAGARAFAPQAGEYRGRWKAAVENLRDRMGESLELTPLQRVHLTLDESEASYSTSKQARNTPPAGPEVGVRSALALALVLRIIGLRREEFPSFPGCQRLAAKIALEEAGLLGIRSPEFALPLAEFAVATFRACEDRLGLLHAVGLKGTLIVLGKLKPPETVRADLALALDECRKAGLVPFVAADRFRAQRALSGGQDTEAAIWLPWLVRFDGVTGLGAADYFQSRGVPTDLGLTEWVHHLVPPTEATRVYAVRKPFWQLLVAAVQQKITSVVASTITVFGAALSIALLMSSRLVSHLDVPLIERILTFDGFMPSGFETTAALVGLATVLATLADRFEAFKAIVNRSAIGIIVIGVAVALYAGFSKLVDLFFDGVPVAAKIGLFVLALVLLGSVPSLLGKLKHALENCFRVVISIDRTRGARITFSIRTFAPLEGPETILRMDNADAASGPTSSYQERASRLPVGARRIGPGNSPSRITRRGGIRWNCDLVVEERLAAEPWEALLSQPGKDSANPVDFFVYRFRRTDVVRRGSWWRQLPSTRTVSPSPQLVNVDLAFNLTDTPRLRDVWVQGFRLTKGYVVRSRSLTPEATHSSPSVLHVIDEIREIEGGLAVQLDPGQYLFPADLVRRYGGLRMVILQLPVRSELRRFDFDRAEAARARTLAAQLAKAGVAAVVVLPSLPELIALRCLHEIVSVIDQGRQRSELALMYAVQEIMELIGNEVRNARAPSSESNVGDAAMEIPFDVCLYCRDNLDLSVQPREGA